MLHIFLTGLLHLTVIALSVGALMLSMHLVGKFANLTIPELPEWACKVAAIQVAAYVISGLIPWLGWILGIAITWTLLNRWFDADFWAIVYVNIANAVLLPLIHYLAAYLLVSGIVFFFLG